MRTRRQTEKEPTSPPPPPPASSAAKGSANNHDAEGRSIADSSRNAVNRVIRRVNARGSLRTKKELQQDKGSKSKDKHIIDAKVTWNEVDALRSAKVQKESDGGDIGASSCPLQNSDDDIDWEDGSTSAAEPVITRSKPGDGTKTLIIEFGTSPYSASRKPSRRATAEEKELAELVHRAHLLCLLARGIVVDSACDDPLLQASLVSLLPTYLLKIPELSKVTAKALAPIFHSNFHVKSAASKNHSFSSALAFALENREGSAEEHGTTVILKAVLDMDSLRITGSYLKSYCHKDAVFHRFVSILDVASIKPDVDDCESSSHSASRVRRGIFNSSTPMVDRLQEISISPNACESSSKGLSKSKETHATQKKIDFLGPDELKVGPGDSLPSEPQCNSLVPNTEKFQGSKRKSDIEFEMQLQMALSATAVADPKSSVVQDATSPNTDCCEVLPSPKRVRRVEIDRSMPISTAIGSRKMGSPLYWAEIYCTEENLAGKWVHVDAINAIIDGEHQVEAAATACKTSLRYAVAFAGRGAKDVTRRYCMKWHKIASQRVNSTWWDTVLRPLRELESGATGAPLQLAENGDAVAGPKADLQPSWINSFVASRDSLEDMELETRALTEPLPTNQQAYRRHHLYAIERWLTKFQILHPKGPVLGFCSGNPVYPRACVQTLKTKERWLREGLQVKANELPAKVLLETKKFQNKVQFSEGDDCNSKGNFELYGEWQLEPLQLPPAVNGIVPKNERGQVDVWSEKCLPPGTVHLRLPRVFNVAKRLDIDYAPAMVGFEFRNGRSVPIYDGIVVCTEFKDVILEAYDEEEDRRKAEEKRRDEAIAVSRSQTTNKTPSPTSL
ncbi:unnamed protein product, partial [Linum tenue]